MLLIPAGLAAERIRFAISAETLPSVVLLPESGLVVTHSDTVWLGSRQLRRDQDYRIALNGPTLTLLVSSDTSSDSLVAVYHTVPRWLSRWYGREVPEATTTATSSAGPNRPPMIRPALPPSRARISGTKSLRVFSTAGGNAEFGQSLDLRMDGEIAPGVQVRGVLSDRGTPGAYGPLNSRVEELDKISLAIESPVVSLNLGDLSSTRFQPSRVQRVAGVTGELHQPNWRIAAIAARPKGQFASVRIAAQDRFQGPYQIRQSGALVPVVPGSEAVWLDGVLLAGGADRDYQIDYAAAQITFTARSLIDSRSRIEIDCEFQQSAYRGELLGGLVGMQSRDSSRALSVLVLREGDDPDLPLSGSLSSADLEQLRNAGDRGAFRSGVIADSLGDYVLVTDSLPDTVYSYSGAGAGDYRITFSYVGSNLGRYRYLGSGVFRFAGQSSGDYEPVVQLSAPRRTDLVSARGNVRVGQSLFEGNVDFAKPDNNLLSPIDDHDNGDLGGRLRWQQALGLVSAADTIVLDGQYRGAEFAQRDRFLPPDWERRVFAPRNVTTRHDIRLLSARAVLHPGLGVTVAPEFEELSIIDTFTSRSSGVDIARSGDSGYTGYLKARYIATRLDKAEGSGDGKAWRVGAGWGMGVVERWRSLLEWSMEDRRHDYLRYRSGTIEARLRGSLFRADDSLQYEYYREDELIPVLDYWATMFTRHRMSAVATQQLGRHRVSGTLGRQWLQTVSGWRASDNYHARYRFDDPSARLYFATAYRLSQELRIARGVTYLPIEPGRGNYRFENGQYIPDPDGDFLQVEELLSDREAASVLEKSHEIRYDPSWGQFRAQSRVSEEVRDSAQRTVAWLAPALLSKRENVRAAQARDDFEARLVRWGQVYAITLRGGRDLDRRTLALGEQTRQSLRGEIVFNEPTGALVLEQRASLFRSEREDLSLTGTKVDGHSIGMGLRRTAPRTELGVSVSWRSARAGIERSELLQTELRCRLRALRVGELGANLELYRDLATGSKNVDYLLTDSRPGRQGALWAVNAGLTLKGKTRARLNISGRHSDIRTGRVTARGELVAEF